MQYRLSIEKKLGRGIMKEAAWVAEFRWDDRVWGASWTGMGVSVVAYVVSMEMGRRLLLRLRAKPVGLGPIPALYHLLLLLLSLLTFGGCLLSTRSEIRQTRWMWRRSKTEMEWLICFPVGMRPTGRIFFWTYLLYIAQYVECLGTLILILQKRSPSASHLCKHALMLVSCFLQLHFAQSLQIIMLLCNTGFSIIMHLYFFLFYFGQAPSWYRQLIPIFQIIKYAAMYLASSCLLVLHFTTREGCNGMGSWLFISFLNAILLPLTSRLDRRSNMPRSGHFS